jgi:hypothetical protein
MRDCDGVGKLPMKGVHPQPEESDIADDDGPEDRGMLGSRTRLNERLRAAFVAGAEEDSRRRLGRGLSREELERVLLRYPGDV